MILDRINSAEIPNGYKMVSVGDKVPAGTVLAWKVGRTGMDNDEWRLEQFVEPFVIPSGYRCAALFQSEAREW